MFRFLSKKRENKKATENENTFWGVVRVRDLYRICCYTYALIFCCDFLRCFTWTGNTLQFLKGIGFVTGFFTGHLGFHRTGFTGYYGFHGLDSLWILVWIWIRIIGFVTQRNNSNRNKQTVQAPNAV